MTGCGLQNEDALFERATLGRAIRKAAKDTADIAAQKVYDIGTSGGSRLNRPSIFGCVSRHTVHTYDILLTGCIDNSGKKPSIPKPRPGGIRPIKFPSGGINAPKKPRVNFKAAWDAAKKKKSGGGRKPKPTRRPAKHVPRPGGHAGKPVMMPKKAKKGRK